MKRLLIIILSISVLGACRYRTGSGNIVTEKRNTGSFTGISVVGGFEVEVKTGPVEVIAESDDNIIKYIRTDVVNGVLRIRIDQINLHDAHLKVYVTAPEINNIKTSASANVDVKDVLRSGQAIRLHSSSGSEIKADLDAPDVFVDASSGAQINLSGKTRNFDAESSSGSSVNAKGLLSENTTARVSSGATAHVHASISLTASASSGGSINYRGAGNVKKTVSSGGSVEKEGE